MERSPSAPWCRCCRAARSSRTRSARCRKRWAGAALYFVQFLCYFIDYNVEAEALGFRSTFVVEHHFTGFGQVSATLNLFDMAWRPDEPSVASALQ